MITSSITYVFYYRNIRRSIIRKGYIINKINTEIRDKDEKIKILKFQIPIAYIKR